MKEQNAGEAIAHLSEAVTIQDELANHRLALEWAQISFDRLLRMWLQLETHEDLAYEDKLTTQIQVLDETTDTLRHLHATLAPLNRLLRGHRQHLRQLHDPIDL